MTDLVHVLSPLAAHLADLASVVVAAEDKGPKPEDVKAGWGAFAIFIGLCLLVAFLGWSLTRQLKKVEKARLEGVYGEEAQNRAPANPPIPFREDDAPRA